MKSPERAIRPNRDTGRRLLLSAFSSVETASTAGTTVSITSA